MKTSVRRLAAPELSFLFGSVGPTIDLIGCLNVNVYVNHSRRPLFRLVTNINFIRSNSTISYSAKMTLVKLPSGCLSRWIYLTNSTYPMRWVTSDVAACVLSRSINNLCFVVAFST